MSFKICGYTSDKAPGTYTATNSVIDTSWYNICGSTIYNICNCTATIVIPFSCLDWIYQTYGIQDVHVCYQPYNITNWEVKCCSNFTGHIYNGNYYASADLEKVLTFCVNSLQISAYRSKKSFGYIIPNAKACFECCSGTPHLVYTVLEDGYTNTLCSASSCPELTNCNYCNLLYQLSNEIGGTSPYSNIDSYFGAGISAKDIYLIGSNNLYLLDYNNYVIGCDNYDGDESIIVGNSNSLSSNSIIVGNYNCDNSNSIIVGNGNGDGNYYSIIVGNYNCDNSNSIIVGNSNRKYNSNSIIVGNSNCCSCNSFIVGNGVCCSCNSFIVGKSKNSCCSECFNCGLIIGNHIEHTCNFLLFGHMFNFYREGIYAYDLIPFIGWILSGGYYKYEYDCCTMCLNFLDYCLPLSMVINNKRVSYAKITCSCIYYNYYDPSFECCTIRCGDKVELFKISGYF